MTYRDDRDADRARIEALEAELASARRELAEARGEQTTALVAASGNALAVAQGGPAPWYGAPTRLELTRHFAGEYPRDRLEELVDRIRSISRDPGHAEIRKSSLTWTAAAPRHGGVPQAMVTVAIRDGSTTLAVTASLAHLAGGIYGGIGGGVGGGGLMAPIGIALAINPLLLPVMVVGWLGGVFLGARAIYKGAARRHARRLQELFTALTTDIARALPPAP